MVKEERKAIAGLKGIEKSGLKVTVSVFVDEVVLIHRMSLISNMYRLLILILIPYVYRCRKRNIIRPTRRPRTNANNLCRVTDLSVLSRRSVG